MHNDDKARVLAAADIVRVIGEHVALKPKGKERVCLCPFHEDRNPSMYVVPAKQMYHCFVCGAGGNAITFVMEYHKMSFKEALEYLAGRFGVTLTPWKPSGPMGGRRSPGGSGEAGESGAGDEQGPAVSREHLAMANAVGQGYFRAILKHAEHGSAARAVIERRGISAEMVERFGLGSSADRWDGLAMTLAAKGQPIEAFMGAGLLKSRDSGGVYDAFRNRLIFPIHDMLGRVIAFGARRLNDADEPKYLNSSESALFNKSATLYALPLASAAIRSSGKVVVCEGYMDAIACHQAGITNVVATLGTALTAQSARVLQRLCSTVVLLFDGDEAGQRAADRAIEVLFDSSLEVKIAVLSAAKLPEGARPKDPDELLKLEGGTALLLDVIERATDALEFRFARLKKVWGTLNLSDKAAAVDTELARLLELGLNRMPLVRKNLIVRRIAVLSGVDEMTIRGALRERPGVGAGPRAAAVSSAGAESGMSAARQASTLRTPAQVVVACMLVDPALGADLGAADWTAIASSCEPAGVDSELVAVIVAVRGEGQTADVQAVVARCDEGPVVGRVSAMAAEMAKRTDNNPVALANNFTSALTELRREHASVQQAGLGGVGGDGAATGGAGEGAAGQPSTVADRLAAMQRANAAVGRSPRRMPRPL